MKKQKVYYFGELLFLVCFLGSSLLRAEDATVTVDFQDQLNRAVPLFGSNVEVYDNQRVRKRLVDERVLDRGFEWALDQSTQSFFTGGAVGTVTQDSIEQYAGRFSKKIDITSFGGGSAVSFTKGQVWVEGGQTYNFSFWAKHTGYSGTISITMSDLPGTLVIAQSPLIISSVSTSWTKYTGTLTITQSDLAANLAFLFNATGTVWIDQMSLTPAVVQNNVKPSVSNALEDLGMRIVRFPGGAESNAYDWKKGIGPQDQRDVNVTVRNSYTAEVGLAHYRKPYYNDFGIDEFLQLAETMGWEPLITVNLASGAVVAADLVEYCNGDSSTTQGALRATNGHPAPYNVRYWEVGNEIWNQISPEPGSLPNPGGYTQANTDNYISQFRSFSDAMKAKGSTILVGAVGGHKPSDSYMTGLVDPNWTEDVIAGAADKMDFISVHFYGPADDDSISAGGISSEEEDKIYRSAMGAPIFFEEELAKIHQIIAASGNPNIRVAVTEYNASSVDLVTEDPFYAEKLEGALFVALMNNVFLRQRVFFATQWDLMNEKFSLFDHDVDGSNNGVIVESGLFHVSTLLKDYLKSIAIPTSVQSAFFASESVGWMRSESHIPLLDVVGTLDISNKEVSLFVINRDKDNDISVRVNFQNFPGNISFQNGSFLTANRVSDRNTVSAPSLINRQSFSSLNASRVAASRENLSVYSLSFPKASVTAVQFSFNTSSSHVSSAIAFPNPFRFSQNSGIEISPLPENSVVSFYTMTGKLVRKLNGGSSGKVVWNGLNDSHQKVATGVYLVVIKSGGEKETLKVVVSR